MAPRAKKTRKKPTTRRARKFTGANYYVGCRQIDTYLTDPGTANGLMGSFEDAERRAQDSIEKDGKTRYILQVVAKVRRETPPVKTTML